MRVIIHFRKRGDRSMFLLPTAAKVGDVGCAVRVLDGKLLLTAPDGASTMLEPPCEIGFLKPDSIDGVTLQFDTPVNVIAKWPDNPPDNDLRSDVVSWEYAE